MKIYKINVWFIWQEYYQKVLYTKFWFKLDINCKKKQIKNQIMMNVYNKQQKGKK